MDDRPDIAVPGYEILSFLGRGAMGTVYKARQVSMGREVALKVIHSTISSHKDFVPRFLREARTVARLSHGNIVAGYDVGQVGDLCYLAMEFIDGESCQARLTRLGRLDEPETIRIAIQVARALQHAHRSGVVHRDVKPANIMLAEGDVAKLCDFGLARATERGNTLTKGGTCLGTPMYMAPEQGGELDIRSDIYSLGASLYHLVTGVPLFEGPSMMAILMKHVMQPVVPPRRHRPEMTAAFEAVILRALAKRPEDRYEEPSLLEADLDRVAQPKAPRSSAPHFVITPEKKPAPARRPPDRARPLDHPAAQGKLWWPRRRRVAWTIVASFLAVGLGLVAAAIVSVDPAQVATTPAGQPSDPVRLLLDDIQESARGWESHPERLPEIVGRLEDLVGTKAFGSCPAMAEARQRLVAFRKEVDAEAARRIGPLMERCELNVQSKSYAVATRELDQFIHDFAGVDSCPRARVRRDEILEEARLLASAMLVSAGRLLDSGEHAAARAAIEETMRACPADAISALPDFRQQAGAILTLVEEGERKARAASAWTLIAEHRFAAAREALTTALAAEPKGSRTGDLRADLDELDIIESIFAAADKGARRLAESREKRHLVLFGEEVGFESTSDGMILLRPDGGRRTLDVLQLAAEDVLQLATEVQPDVGPAGELRVGLLFYVAILGGRRDTGALNTAERKLDAATRHGELSAARHLAEIRRIRTDLGLPCNSPDSGASVMPQGGTGADGNRVDPGGQTENEEAEREACDLLREGERAFKEERWSDAQRILVQLLHEHGSATAVVLERGSIEAMLLDLDRRSLEEEVRSCVAVTPTKLCGLEVELSYDFSDERQMKDWEERSLPDADPKSPGRFYWSRQDRGLRSLRQRSLYSRAQFEGDVLIEFRLTAAEGLEGLGATLCDDRQTTAYLAVLEYGGDWMNSASEWSGVGAYPLLLWMEPPSGLQGPSYATICAGTRLARTEAYDVRFSKRGSGLSLAVNGQVVAEDDNPRLSGGHVSLLSRPCRTPSTPPLWKNVRIVGTISKQWLDEQR